MIGSPFGIIETCEGTVCARCKIEVSMCACVPRPGFVYRSLRERISAQGLVPATPEREAA